MSAGWTREQMAARAAQDIPDGSYVNLGIGIPELIAHFVPDGREFIYHTENGLLGMGPPPSDDEKDLDLMNAGKKYVTAMPGAAYFHHADSFSMIRGGHIDYCVLGTMQVAANGDIANWSTGAPDAIPAVGGARRDGPGSGREKYFRHNAAYDQDGRAETGREVQLSAHRAGRCVSHFHQPRRC
jgi:3-oxoadipate CoA-transferase beta subunit